jgi:hypothetical protein
MRARNLVSFLTLPLALCPASVCFAQSETTRPVSPAATLETRAAIVADGMGEARTVPQQYDFIVIVSGDGETDDAAKAACRKNQEAADAAIRRLPYPGIKLEWTGPLRTFDSLPARATIPARNQWWESKTSLRAAERVAADKIMEALFAAGIPGRVRVTLTPGKNLESGYRNALKQAARNARIRAGDIADAGQLPREAVELLGLRERWSLVPDTIVVYDLPGKRGDPFPETVPVQASVVTYWGIREGYIRPTIPPTTRSTSQPPKAKRRTPGRLAAKPQPRRP